MRLSVMKRDAFFFAGISGFMKGKDWSRITEETLWQDLRRGQKVDEHILQLRGHKNSKCKRRFVNIIRETDLTWKRILRFPFPRPRRCRLRQWETSKSQAMTSASEGIGGRSRGQVANHDRMNAVLDIWLCSILYDQLVCKRFLRCNLPLGTHSKRYMGDIDGPFSSHFRVEGDFCF